MSLGCDARTTHDATRAIGLTPAPIANAAQPNPNRTTPQEFMAEVGAEWLTNEGNLSNTRYSTLAAINANNVADPKGAWLARLGSGAGLKYRFEAER